ncbi:DUF6048 family protein [Gillisia limnaea]|uniref:Uncharacterized protein n=1 Tax=Gillisia limnaea (strain DSM 15749 / LMG 21470 / R-8282) TaxID=865937 RepID=H2BV61_GILLR|nr:DUF6048 family protein [Gillisia limnaea]EHQ03951.1 hypothetical protein Gilli_3350 [Gillisia limnaea DSM 15749]
MKQIRIFLFTISILFFFSTNDICAQTATDSIQFKEKYGLRLGIDLSKPLRTLLDDDYSGLEILGDYRVYKNYYAAAEIGNEKMDYSEDNLSVTSNGSYIKFGVDYNAYENWAGMENMIFVGLRYGFATFSQTLNEYAIYTDTQFFPPNIVQGPFETSGLTASWVELMVGMKVELFNNIFLGANLQLKRRVTQSTPTNFDNLTIPGFNRTYDDSTFGVGYGYTISYLIPLYKKAKD